MTLIDILPQLFTYLPPPLFVVVIIFITSKKHSNLPEVIRALRRR